MFYFISLRTYSIVYSKQKQIRIQEDMTPPLGEVGEWPSQPSWPLETEGQFSQPTEEGEDFNNHSILINQICPTLCDNLELERDTDTQPFQNSFGMAKNVKIPKENFSFFQWCATNRAIFSECNLNQKIMSLNSTWGICYFRAAKNKQQREIF